MSKKLVVKSPYNYLQKLWEAHMTDILKINDLECRIIKSKRKTLAVEVTESGGIILRLPKKATLKDAENLVIRHSEWIKKALKKQSERHNGKYIPTPEEEQNLRKLAKQYLPERTAHWSKITGLTPTGIKITSAQKRFGSCNTKNSICFSYFLMLYPKEAIDYVIVHELCHIKHKNHSADFYKTVSKYYPGYKKAEKLLKQPPKENPFG